AEDGIRDFHVTGVQTCALPISNVDIRQEVAEGNFREDLLYRLNTVELHLPALRERREDLPLLATHFLRRQATQYRKTVTSFSPRSEERRVGKECRSGLPAERAE